MAFHCGRAGPTLLFSNVSRRRLDSLHRPIGSIPFGACTTAWSIGAMPSWFALVDLTRFAFPVPLPPTRFPLRLTELTSFPVTWGTFRSMNVSDGEDSYVVRVWMGHNATATIRREVAQLLGSIRPRS